MAESTFCEDWDEIGSIGPKKAILVLETTIFQSLPGVNGLTHAEEPHHGVIEDPFKKEGKAF